VLAALQHAQWAANGLRVDSCAEYVYEKYYDYMQFKDAMAGRATRYPEIVRAAYDASEVVTAIGTRGTSGALLKMKEGLDLPVQAPESGYVVDVDPDSDCYFSWQRIRVDNVFHGMPMELADPAFAIVEELTHTLGSVLPDGDRARGAT